MSQRAENKAAWLMQKGQPFEIKQALYTKPQPNQVVIRSKAVAVNLFERFIAEFGKVAFPWIDFPLILGTDVAGHIVEIGSGVTGFEVGDRVVGAALGVVKNKFDSTQAAFQKFVLLREDMVTRLPKNISYEQACVMPLCLGTAATALYMKNTLRLPLPTLNAYSIGKTLLVWGGSTSVGVNAIQLARHSGYEVITTCSKRNHDLVHKLGASQAFDYNAPGVTYQIIKAFEGKECAGALAIGSGSTEKCVSILGNLDKTKTNKLVIPASQSYQPNGVPIGLFALIAMLFYMWMADLRIWFKCKMLGVKTTEMVFGSDYEETEVAGAIWKSFLGDALAKGTFVPSPEPLVVETRGLEGIQQAYKVLEKRVSAQKVVVSLE